jgi:hypothetical protein
MLNKILVFTKEIIGKINPEKKWLWIVLFLGINFSHLALFHHFVINREEGKLYALGGDGDQYVGATESLLANGEMTFMKSNQHLFYSNLLPQDEFDLGMYYAFRTPGFVFVHLPLRWFFDLHTSLNIFIVLQTIVNAFAKFFLCLLFYRIFKSKILFFSLVIGFALAIQLSFWNNHLMTESFGVSFLIFSIWTIYQYQISSKYKYLFYSGLFLILAVHFRPFLAPLFLTFTLIIWVKNKKQINKKILIPFIYLIIPILLIHGPWIVRNYIKTEKIILIAPTHNWINYINKTFRINQQICFSLSKSPLWWDKSSPMYYLENLEDNRTPIELYGDNFFEDIIDTIDVIKAKKMYLQSKNTILYTLDRRKYFEISSFKLLENLNNKYLQAHPFNFINSRLKTFIIYLNQPLFKPFISLKYPFNVLSVVIESLVNRFIYFIGVLSIFLSLFRFKNNLFLISLSILSIFIFMYFVTLNYIEHRELYIPAYFFIIFGIEWMYKLIKDKNTIILSIILICWMSLVAFDVMNKIQWG